MPWILLWPLYITLCRSPGLEIALTVPSMNPKQLSKAAPLAEIASAYICKETGFKIPLFQLVILRWWVSYMGKAAEKAEKLLRRRVVDKFA